MLRVNKSAKLPEIRKESFTAARERLGLTVKELSAKSCFSVRQIEQLENGENSSFYSPQVKVTAAKKVASLLNLSEEEAFDFGGLFPSGKAGVDKPAEPVAQSQQEQAVEPVATPKAKPSATSTVANKPVAAKSPNRKFIIGLSVVAALVFSIINLRPLFFPEPVKEQVVVVEEVSPPSSTVDANADAKGGSKSEATSDVTPAATSATPMAIAATSEVSSDCPAADAAITYKPDAPKKGADLVYLQARNAQTVCVVDASGKTQNKTLEPGVGVSVYGKPPFKVLTAGLNQVDIYFQGAKVRTGSAGNAGKTIILEAAEVVQPTASTDSQLR
jgi:cytoskeleton protein RodZ